MNPNAAANSGLKKHIGLHPNLMICHLCGREYGSLSLPLHIPKCEEKWTLEQQKVPKKMRRPMPKAPQSMPLNNATGTYETLTDDRPLKGMTGSQILEYNEAAQQAFIDEGRCECMNCGRKFLQDRYYSLPFYHSLVW
jgi:hypothetical protein